MKNRKEVESCHAFPIIGIHLLTVILVNLRRYPVVGTTCGIATSKANARKIDFCSEKMIEGTEIVFDGQYLSANVAVQSCTCKAKAQHKTATKMTFTDFLKPSLLSNNCGSKVVFSQESFVEHSQRCHINGSMSLNVTENIVITLKKETRSADTRYCFKVTIDQGNVLNIICNQTDLWLTTSLDGQTDRSSQTLYIAIGSGIGGVILVVIVVICLVTKSRSQTGLKRESNEPREVNDDYGLQYNTVYVSNDDDCVQQNIRNRQEEYVNDVCQISYKVEGNYSEIDLEDMPKNKIKTVSAIDETGNFAMNLDNSSSVRHVVAPGDDGVEYAVVEKPNDDSCKKDYVYAVVDKTRKNDI